MAGQNGILYTIGHSTHSIEYFMGLLKKHSIDALGDVRSSPFSQFSAQFNRPHLEKSLKKEGIYYIFMGKELGARRLEDSCRIGNKVNYRLVAQTPLFKEGLTRLESGVKKMSVAIMCAEKDPLVCHRTVLIAHFGRERFRDIHHILEDGTIETCTQTDHRLLTEYGMSMEDFFISLDEKLRIVYEKRGERIAYLEEEEPELIYG